MEKRIRNFLNSHYSLPIIIFFLGYLCYGLLAPWTRFFHDELSMLWFFQKMNDLGRFFEGNRPFLKYLYEPFLWLFGSSSFLWALFSVFTRWLLAMSVYWLIKYIWPEKSILAIAICCFTVVYPGFQAQYSSMIFGIAFLIFSLFVLSLLFSIKAVDSPEHKLIYLIAAICFSAASLFTSEYFFTLEFVRYFLIWVYVKNTHKGSQFKNSLIFSSPYLILYFCAIVWRLFQESDETAYSLVLINNLKASFFPTIINQFLASLKDIWYTTFKVWFDSIYPSQLIAQQGQRIIILYFGLIVATFIVLATFLGISSNKEVREKNRSGSTNILVFGLISIVAAGIPFWLAGLPVNEKYFYTRWTIPFIIGSSILVPLLLSFIFNKKTLFVLIISALVSFGAGTQFLAANSFRHDWNNQNLLFWELKWRIPSLKEDTVIFSDMLDFHYENSDQLSSGINFALTGKGQTSQIPYFLFYLPERIHTSILPELRNDIPLTGKRYYSYFKGNTSQAILIDFNPPGCLRILDPVLDLENPDLDTLTKQALFLSRNELINPINLNNPDPGSIDIIGSEPPKDWCYYFEKADLASQFQQWDVIGNLYQEVLAKEYKPRYGQEWLPFIEGLSHLSNWKESSVITENAMQTNDELAPMLCALWKRISINTPDSPQKKLVLSEINTKLECKQK